MVLHFIREICLHVIPNKRELLKGALRKNGMEVNVNMIEELIRRSRSYRRFQENRSVDKETLQELINLARLSPSAANLQPLKYIISNTPEKNSLIFPCLAWAAYLRDWPGPQEGERPSAYIIVLGDTEITKNFGCDHGIAAQSILLGATERGLNGCMIGSVQKEKLRGLLKIPERYEILLVIVLGVRKETVVIEEVKAGDIKYWRDEKGVHHVPKRPLTEIILEL
jgi:nitroreductase